MSHSFTEAWLIAAPSTSTSRDGSNMKRKLDAVIQGHATSSSFSVPLTSLRVGTLDSLMGLSDEMQKVDTFIEGVCFKLSQYLVDLYENDAKKAAAAMKVKGDSPEDYLKKYSWDLSKFNVNLPLKTLTTEITKKVSQIEAEMKTKFTQYSKAKSNLQSLDRKTQGSLLVKNLANLVTEKNFVSGSEYLVTLLVVVPKYSVKDWFATYETLVPEKVVPRSTEGITEDDEYALFTVTVFRRAVDDFKVAAREKKFVVRDFEYNKNAIAEDEEQRAELTNSIQKKFNILVNWCKVNFEETYEAWIHLKALRVFVESVLRYGLPVNFEAVLVQPSSPNYHRKLRQILQTHYSHLDAMSSSGKDDNMSEMATSLGMTSQEYFSYVSLNVQWFGS